MTHRNFSLAVALLFLVAPVAFAVDPSDLKPGLVAEYRERTGGRGSVVRLEPTVAWAAAEGESAHPKLGDTEVVRWSGYLNVVRAGKYRFSAVARNGHVSATVGKDTVLALKSDPNESRSILDGPEVDLAGGVQPFSASLTEAGKGGLRFELLWEGPGFRREPVPHAFFGHLPADRPPAFAAQATEELGRYRFEELACVRCHRPAAGDKMAAGLVSRPGPILTDAAKRAYPGWLNAWLADPKKLRPHTTMPQVFADAPAGRAERYAVVKFLTALAGNRSLDPSRGASLPKDYSKSMEAGRVLFGVTGCAACHQQPGEPKKPARNDGDDEKLPLGPDDYVYGAGSTAGPASKYAIGAVGSKTRPEALADYLQNPLKAHPAGRMPNMVLEGKEALDLARYLCRVTDDGIDPKMPPAPAMKPAELFAASSPTPVDLIAFEKLPADLQWAEVGKRTVVSKGCVNCHEIAAGRKPLEPATSFPTLADVRGAAPGKGCLAAEAGKAPYFKLDVRDAAALAAFVKDGLAGAGAKAPTHAARLSLKRFNCLNCHQRDGEGGLSLELADQMRLLEKAENADDVRPPVLTGIGHKSRTSWLKGVLTEKQRARPWMQLRMPQYGEGNVGHLPMALAALEGTEPDDAVHKVPLTAAKVAAGRTIVGKGGMGCISCHDISGVPNSGTRGPDLATIDRRVRYDWYLRWLSQPLRMAPGTRMPQAFVDGKSPLTTVLHGDADAQAEAMWTYLSLGFGLPLPDGMEPPKGLTLAVKERPEVMRTFLKDGGNRAIAVGYPGGVSVAFSADECRLVYAWAGNFLDATPVWDKRGGKAALVLGPKFWTSPPGQPWGLTAAGAAPPDFAARATDPAYGAVLPQEPPLVYAGPRAVAFDGYDLDKYGAPNFRYHVVGSDGKALKVAETPGPLNGGLATGLRRAFVIEAPGGTQPWLLAGTTTREPRLIGNEAGPIPLDLKAAAPTAPAANARVLLPADGERVTVLELPDAPAGALWQFVPKAGGGWSVLVKMPADKVDSATTLALNVWSLPKDDPELLKSLAAK